MTTEGPGGEHAEEDAVRELRKLLRQLDHAWKALGVLGPDTEVSSALDVASARVQRYLTAFDDRPQQRAARKAHALLASGAHAKPGHDRP